MEYKPKNRKDPKENLSQSGRDRKNNKNENSKN